MVRQVHILILLLITFLIPQDWSYSSDVATIKKVPEEFIDFNKNGQWDKGETFIDSNKNGQWDKDSQTIKEFNGDVIINRDGLELRTDQAIQYVNANKIELKGSISVIDDKSTINCQELIYYTDKEYFEAYNDVVVTQEDKTIYSDILYYWDKKDSIRSEGNVKIIEKGEKRRLYADELYIFFPDSTTQFLQLSGSSEVFNITKTKPSKDSPMMEFEDEMKGKIIQILIEQDTLRKLDIYGMGIANYHVIKDSLLMGLNNVSGDSISINFDKSELSRMQVIGGALGEFIPEKGNSKVDSTVYYKADFIDYIIDEERSILQKEAEVDYGSTIIESGNIVVDWNTNMLDAEYAYDIYPKVSNANESPMIGESMRFDLINKKGIIRKGKTNFDDGFYHGRTIQREDPNIFHMFDSQYTSCSLDHPHYYFGSKRMKMIQGDKIVARPITLYIADFPVFKLPFAILPNKSGGRRSGWIMPSFGNSQSRGNFIQNLGYYWAPNDFSDSRFLFSLYDLRGFNLKSYFRYKKRYKYDGSIRSTFKRDLYLTEDITDIFTDKTTQDWDFHWVHNQTFDPYQTLNIDLTYITSNNFYQSDNVGFDLETRLKQKIESSVNYSKTWPTQKNTLTLYLAETYDMLTFDESATEDPIYYKIRTLPKLTFRHNSTRLFGDGNRWYNNIYSSMSSITTGNQKVGFYAQNYGVLDEGEAFIDAGDLNGVWDEGEEIIDSKIDTTNYNKGIVHNINFSFSNKVFKWFSVTPSVNLKESWIFRYKEYNINEEGEFEDSYHYNDSFKRRLSGSLSMSLGTKLYGIIPFSIGRLNSFRHVLSPSVSFSYLPDLSNNSSLFQISESGDFKDYFSGSLVGGTSTSKSRRYSLSVRNDFQVKYQNLAGNYEKANFLNWTLTTAYNPDSDFRWSNINSTVQAIIPELFNVDISMIHDPYKQEYDGSQGSYERINDLESFPRLTYISASTDIGLSGNQFDYSYPEENAIIQDTLDFDEKINLARSVDPYEPIIESGKVWDTGLRLHYSLVSYAQEDQIKWDKTFWVNSDININLTNSWKMTYSARFDLVDNKIVSHSIYLFRPLHCWEFSFKWWPSGNNKGFMLNIYVKNPNLRDIKVKSTGGSFFGL